MRDAVTELLADLGRVLDAAEVRWYVFGAQAVIVHGVIRHTADVDVAAEISPQSLPGVIERLRTEGFSVRVADLDAFVRETHVAPLLHEPTGLPVDLVLAGPGPEQGFLERAVRVEAGGVQFPVVSAEDLIVLKMLAGRPKDLEDVRGIVQRRRSQVDVEVARERLREIELLLDRSDLTAALDRLLDPRRPKKQARPRRRRRR